LRIISPATLQEYAVKHTQARSALMSWQTIVENAKWQNPNDVKLTIGSVDLYTTERLRRILYIFDICHNAFRLICAIHFPRTKNETGRVYLRNFLTHAQYLTNRWKTENDKD
jgi:mRNA-degrading endonuclease HigB of HigAB toxin-antitoxin module